MKYNELLKHISLQNLSKEELRSLKLIIKDFNSSKDILYKKLLAYKILDLTNFIFGICRICNDLIIYNHMRFAISYDKILWLCAPTEYTRTINNVNYYLSCCELCLRKQFKDNEPKTNTLIFSKGLRWSAFVYNIPADIAADIRKNTVAVTLKSMIRKYGEIEGTKRWNIYKDKLRISNTFEYKHQKYGWTEMLFKLYNFSRSVTKQNLINKYGEELGNQKWTEYINKQSETKSFQYMKDKYGEQQAIKINKSKAISIDNFINKYGEILGHEKYVKAITKHKSFYSKISLDFFNKLDIILKEKYTTYYATKNGEYGVNLGKQFVKLDYFIKELNLCIEFNGNIFHANPDMFSDDSCPNPYMPELTAKLIREADMLRYNKLKLYRNIDTIVVWESEYNTGINIEEFIKTKLNLSIL